MTEQIKKPATLLERIIVLETQILMVQINLGKIQLVMTQVLEPYIKQQEEKARKIKSAQVRKQLRKIKKQEKANEKTA